MNRLARKLLSALLAALVPALPSDSAAWGEAMRRELAEIGDDAAATAFAWGCLGTALSLHLGARLSRLRASTDLDERAPMRKSEWSEPRVLGLICALTAGGLGAAYLLAAGAPFSHVFVNVAAMIIGVALWFAFSRSGAGLGGNVGPAVLALSIPLVLTAVFGQSVEGASRWISVGPLMLQISLLAVPAMIVLFAARPDAVGAAGAAVAALALAIQPDRAMAGVLAASLLVVAFQKPGRAVVSAAAVAGAAFVWTLLTPDTLPAVPFVDRILYTAFDVHPVAGVAVLLGAALLAAPALLALASGAADRTVLVAFGVCWSGMVAAAALGNYPTPVVGYGGSAVLGYLLSVALLPNRARAAGLRTTARASRPADGSDPHVSELRPAHVA